MNTTKHNPEAELGVIGTLIAEGTHESYKVQSAMLKLREEFFYKTVHKELFKHIKICYDNKHWFDFSTMMDVVRKQNDLADYLEISIKSAYFTGNRLDHEIEELERLWELRGQLNILSNTFNDCINEPLTSRACELLFDGIQRIGAIKVQSMSYGSSYDVIYDNWLQGKYKGNEQVDSGIAQIGKLRNSSLIAIAGGSGVGKTFFSIYMMNQIAAQQPEKQSLFFSLEMAENEIWERHIAIVSDKPFDDLTKNDRHNAAAIIISRETKVYDQPRIDIEYIETICHLEALRKPIAVIVVDYLGLVTSKGKFDREDLRLSDITQRLTALSMKLKCIVIALSQVNRDPAKRTKDDRCPYPSDVADSIGSVRSSSLWIGIDRPELYDADQSMQNVFVAKCRKSRREAFPDAWFSFNNGRFKERSAPSYTPKNRETMAEVMRRKHSSFNNTIEGDF